MLNMEAYTKFVRQCATLSVKTTTRMHKCDTSNLSYFQNYKLF